MDYRSAPTFPRSASRVPAWIVALSTLLGTTVLLWSAAAAAQVQSLAILGVAAEGKDDSLAVGLTDALRAEAESLGVYRLTLTRASLSQMTTVQDCEITESSCRAAVGTALGVEMVLYGSVSAASDKGYHVELHLFATDGGQNTQTERDIPQADADTADIAPHARALLSALRGENEPTDVAAPAVVKPVSGAQAEPGNDEPVPEPTSSHSSNDWIGYTLLGVGAVTTGLTVLSWVQIVAAEDDPDYKLYQKAVGDQVAPPDDVCQEAYNGKLYQGRRTYEAAKAIVVATRDACDKGQTYDRLQYVFLAAALVSFGIGTYFLLDDESDGGSARQAGRRLALLPRVGRDGASLAMHLDF
jgi:hypothetical protein